MKENAVSKVRTLKAFLHYIMRINSWQAGSFCMTLQGSDTVLTGGISFTVVWTALRVYTKKTRASESWRKISEFMCHETHTADRTDTSNSDILEQLENKQSCLTVD